MFKGFKEDLTPLVIPGFKSGIANYPHAPITVFHAVNDCAYQIGGWKEWENYGIFAIQNPLSRIGEALVSMATLCKGTKFKSVEELLREYKFEMISEEELKDSKRIMRKKDTFYLGYHMPNVSVERLARKIHTEYRDRFVARDREEGTTPQLVVAATFSPKRNYQVAKYWHNTFPISWAREPLV
ncbi:MAG TPA: hypothetical protein VHA12_04160 [Candidatus Nanoarchaeia archaeon]|nr:hypothetical protein [Candidatus Nanoarchaeia archaeon]